MSELAYPNPVNKAVARSIEGQEMSWKNALSRKFIGYEVNPELGDDIIHILFDDMLTQETGDRRQGSIKGDLKAFVKLFNTSIDKIPFSGKVLITPALKGSFSERDPLLREYKLVQALLIMLLMSAAHASLANMGLEALQNSSNRLVPSAISLAYFIFNAAVTIRQVELTGRVIGKLTHNSKEIAELIFKDDEALVKLLLDYAEKGHTGMLKYIVAIKGRKKIKGNIDKAMDVVQEACPNGSYEQILSSLTEDKKEEILDTLEEMSADLDEEKKNRLRILVRNIFDMSHFKNTYSFSETMVMLSVTLGGQMAFLFKDVL